MSLTKIKDLTVTELVALAYVEYGNHRFTISGLTSYLSSILSDTFKVGHVQVVDCLNSKALELQLVQVSHGKRGGIGFEVTERGVDAAAEIELPRDKFDRRAKSHEERRIAANANAGPVFVTLLRAISKKDMRERVFIEKLFQHWLAHGWLSSKQVAAMAEIGSRCGEFIELRHYIGTALNEWLAPYVQQQKQALADEWAAHQSLVLAMQNEMMEKERAKEAIRVENRKAKAAIKEIQTAGGLAELDALVAAVFPNINCKDMAKEAAFAGSGSKELRACTAMVAFGKPPASVWKNTGTARQPDAGSEIWQTLVSHPACRLILERHECIGVTEAHRIVE